MSLWLLGIILAPFIFIGLVAGFIEQLKHDPEFGKRLNDWPRLRHGRLPRDSHAQARQDGAFVDGMITGEALNHLDDLFK